MASLFDRLQQQRAAAQEARNQTAEASRAEKRAEREAELNTLLNQRTGLTTLAKRASEAYTTSRATRAEAKAKLRTLIEAHEESLRDPDVEDLPTPREMRRTEGYKGADEVKEYTRALSARKESMHGTSELSEEFAALGIEEGTRISPDDLQKQLKEKTEAVEKSLRTLIAENPDIDSEEAQQMRKEFVLADAQKLGERFDREYARNNVSRDPFRERFNDDKNISRALTEAIQVMRGRQTITLGTVLEQAFPDGKDVDAITTEAVARKLVENAAKDTLLAQSSNNWEVAERTRERILKEELEKKGESIPDDFYLEEDGERFLNEDKLLAYYADTYQQEPAVMDMAKRVIEEYRMLQEVKKGIPEEISTLERREREINKRLEELTPLQQHEVTQDSRPNPRDNDMARAQRAVARSAEKEGKSTQDIAAAREALQLIPRLKADYKPEILNLSVYLNEGRVSLGNDEVIAERQKLDDEDVADEASIVKLDNDRRDIDKESNGITSYIGFKGNKTSKAERKQVKTDAINKLRKNINDRKLTREKLLTKYSQEERTLNETLSRHAGFAAGHFKGGGSLSDFLFSLQEGIREKIGHFEQEQRDTTADAAEPKATLAALEAERARLEEEKQSITKEVLEKEDQKTRLRSELLQFGYRL